MSSTGKFSLRLFLVIGAIFGVAGLFVSAGVATRLMAQSAGNIGIVITEDTRLNVRSGPGEAFAIVAKLDPGAEVEILEASADGAWQRIRTSAIGVDEPAWVTAEFVRVGAAGAPDIAASSAAAAVDEIVLLPTPTPDPKAAGAGDSERTGVASVLKKATASLRGDSPTPVAAIAETDSISDGAALRFGPSLSPVTATAGADDEGAGSVETAAEDTVTDDIVTAAAVTTPESVQAEAAAAPADPEPKVATAVTQPERMNARRGPSTQYEVVASLPAGTALPILALSPQGDWYQVEVAGQAEPAWIFANLALARGPIDGLARLSEDQLPPAPEPAPLAAVQTASAASVTVDVAAAPPPTGGGSFGYGVQAHMLAGESDRALGAVGDMGFNWIKQQVVWANYQPQAGAIGFGELAGIVSVAGQRGINVLFSVVNAPPWARGANADGAVGGPPEDPQTYASFVGAMAGEFCGTALKAIEVWNEQNLHYEWGNLPLDPAAYMNLLKPAYTSIKAACPQMLVISGALTPAGSNPPFAVDDFAYLEGMYQNGLANYSDGIGAHPSGYNVPANVGWEEACGVIQQTGNSFNGACDSPHHSWSFRSTMEGYRNIMVVYGDANKRIWPTEFGWAAGGAFDPRYAYANDNSFDEQAAWTTEAYQMMKAWGWVGPAFLWNLNFRVVADGSEKAQWGIVRNDYSPLPVYQALQAMPK